MEAVVAVVGLANAKRVLLSKVRLEFVGGNAAATVTRMLLLLGVLLCGLGVPLLLLCVFLFRLGVLLLLRSRFFLLL